MTETPQELIARLMQHVEDTMVEASVDYPAGRESGASISYDSDFLQKCFETELAASLRREAALHAAQPYTYIGRDGKAVLARVLEDRAEAAEKREAVLRNALAKYACSCIGQIPDCAQGAVADCGWTASAAIRKGAKP